MPPLLHRLPRQDTRCQEYAWRAGIETRCPDTVIADAVYFNLPLRNLARFVQVYDFDGLADAHFHVIASVIIGTFVCIITGQEIFKQWKNRTNVP
jgi:hypothetical protein